MERKDYKHMEHYKEGKIFIYGIGREWWWETIVHGKSKNSPHSYYSVHSALNNAKKHIDKVAL